MNKNFSYIKKTCPYCNAIRQVVKNGRPKGYQRFKCKCCSCQFTDNTVFYTNELKYIATKFNKKLSYRTVAYIFNIKSYNTVKYWGKQTILKYNKSSLICLAKNLKMEFEELSNMLYELMELYNNIEDLERQNSFTVNYREQDYYEELIQVLKDDIKKSEDLKKPSLEVQQHTARLYDKLREVEKQKKLSLEKQTHLEVQTVKPKSELEAEILSLKETLFNFFNQCKYNLDKLNISEVSYILNCLEEIINSV